MPKKLTEEQKKADLAEYKNSNEYKEIMKCKQDFSPIPTSQELFGEADAELYLKYWCGLFDIMKIAKKPKETYKRKILTAMFSENKNGSSTKEERTVNGVKLLLENATNIEASDCKLLAIDLNNKLIGYQDITPEDYKAKRKEVVEALTKFEKKYNAFIKNGCYDEICKKVIDFGLEPVKIMIEADHNFMKIEMQMKETQKEKEKLVPHFKVKAVTDKFILSLNSLTELLLKIKKIESSLDTSTILSRFEIPNWKNIQPFNYLISHLLKNFNELRETFKQRRKLGEDFWFYNLESDNQLAQLISDIIKKENLCSDFIGDPLKRDQIMFVFDSVKSVFDVYSKREAINNMAAMKIPIAKLAAFRLLINMWTITAKKRFEEKVKTEDMKKYGQKIEVLEMKPPSLENVDTEEEKATIIKDFEMKKYGRYLILEGYIAGTAVPEWIEASMLVKDLNKHALEDIDDFIIIEGMNCKKEELDKLNEETMAKRIKEIQEQVEESKKVDSNKKVDAIKRMEALRPPYVWNLFLEESSPYNDPHRIRYNTNPKALYSDGRVEQFLNKLNLLYVQLVETDKDRWYKLTEKCYSILANKEEQ